MPFWSFLIRTGPEVDDDELPLAKYRLVDDDGRMKIGSRLNLDLDSIIEQANAKKAVRLSPKERAALIKRHTGISIDYGNSNEEEVPALKITRRSVGEKERSASPSPSKVLVGRPSEPLSEPEEESEEVEAPRASKSLKRGASATPTKSPSKPAAKSPAVSPSKAKNGKKSAPQSPKSATKKRGRSTSVAKSAASSRASSRARSRSASASAIAVRSGKPSPRWTVAELRAYVASKGIEGMSGSTKADLLEVIANSQ